MDALLLLVYFALVFWAVGQIWLAQIVVYPLFGQVGASEYVAYHLFYSRRIPVPVILPGFATFILPILLAFFGPAVPTWMHVANIAMGLVGTGVTVLLEIPRHARLEKGGKNERIIKELIRYNWPRTLSITAQAVIAVLMLRHAVL